MSEVTGEVGNTAQSGPLPKTALIAAPSFVDTSAIREALARHGVASFSVDQIDLPGQSLPQLMREGMRRADLVVGVVDTTPASGSVLFELGYAQALDKATLVFVIGDVPLSTWISSGVPYFRFDPENPPGIDYGIGLVLQAPPPGTNGPTTPSKRTRPLGPLADELLLDLRNAGSGRDLERLIERAIRESGVKSFAPGGPQDNSVDFAVWSDDWQPWVGNPLPIQLSLNLRSGEDLNKAIGRLTRAMAPVPMAWGLLLYVDSAMNVAKEVGVPNILALPAEQFLLSLRDTSFGDLIRRLRNQRVHGTA